ncbi:hypothetical protein MtrunA17_Chr1g0204811 [Medicago truncatula]|uniref:Uncharacterized protein n=1 Tax=Medicago truncatula TaxID=3880 RepID=A0A396JUI8_MEDTR|nr:hypothetical protein MtrunA17_Chr1g0204811 [Medicago truncatula]
MLQNIIEHESDGDISFFICKATKIFHLLYENYCGHSEQQWRSFHLYNGPNTVTQ